MMHRVLADWDVVISQEVHLPGVGGSAGPFLSILGGVTGCWKKDDKIQMGSCGVKPMGQGHDGGPGRLHVLVVIPDPTFATSAALSALCTLLSSIKPQFTNHTVQINSGGMLPICAELIPFVGLLSETVCGAPVDIPNSIPIIPTQISVWTGLTWGDIIGGIINTLADMALSFATWGIGNKIKVGADFVEAASKSRMVARLLGNNIFGGLLRVFGVGGGAGGVNLATGPSNLGALAQQAIDGDGVTSDASINVGILGIGAAWNQSSGTSGRSEGAHFMHWFSE